MPRVSLILPTVPGDPRPDSAALSYREALEADGHDVEILIVTGPSTGHVAVDPELGRGVVATHPGLASAAMGGLDAATGEILVILDPRLGYAASDLPRIVAPLMDDEADLVFASRTIHAGPIVKNLGRVARPFTGSTDPLSGLVAVTRSTLMVSFHNFRAVGAKFSLEMLGKIEGRRIDIPVTTQGRTRRDRPGWDDVRHLKRLADHRWGNASRLLQFCFVGASGAIVDLFFYWAFQKIFNKTILTNYVVAPTKVQWSLAAAGSLSILVALFWNFSLNRRMTFSYARGGSLWRQCMAYIASNLPGVIVSLAIRLLLPRKVDFFYDHKLAAAVVGILVATGLSFSMSRWVVFRRNPADDEREATQRPSHTDNHLNRVASLESV